MTLKIDTKTKQGNNNKIQEKIKVGSRKLIFLFFLLLTCLILLLLVVTRS
jgi:hypothetical protein